MNLTTMILTAVSSLGANKLRSSLTLLGIVIGVAAVISLMAIGRGAQERITSRIQSLGTNLLFVRTDSNVSSASTLILNDTYALLDPIFATNVEAVAPQTTVSVRVVAGREDTSTQAVGVTPEYEFVRNFPVESGVFITWFHVQDNAEVAVLGSQVAETLFGFRDPVGQMIRINGRQFTVVGVLESKGGTGFSNQDNQILVPITTAYYRLSSQRTPQGGIAVQSINVQVKDTKSMEEAVEGIAMVLRLRHRLSGDNDFTVTSQQETLETLEETTNTFVVFLGAIAGISLLVGGIGIMNIMLVSVTERTREIGIRKAMGAKRRDILLQFVSEATFLSIGGGVIGVIAGLMLSKLLDGRSFGTQTFTTVFSGDIAILALVVSAAIGLFFGIYPAMRASTLHPIDALRHE